MENNDINELLSQVLIDMENVNNENINTINTSQINTVSDINIIQSDFIHVIVQDDFLELLKHLKGEIFYKILTEHGFNSESLKYMTQAHLSEICPKSLYGSRVIFEYNLRAWQTQQGIVTTSNSPTPSCSPTLSCSSSFENFCEEDDCIDEIAPKHLISTVLNKSIRGKNILEFYKKDNFLNDKYRRILGEIVIETLIHKKIQANPKFFKKVAEEIVKLFPSEVEETYYIRIPKRRPGGILYARYHNVLSKLKSEGLAVHKKSKAQSTLSFSSISCDAVVEESSEISEESIRSEKEWLKYNIEPFDTVLDKWKLTSKYRCSTLKKQETIVDILDEWPSYKQSFGHHLIDTDFCTIYTEKQDKLYQNWENFSNRILPQMKIKIKDDYSKSLLTKYFNDDKEKNLDVKNLVIFMLLPALIVPTSRVSTGSFKYKK